MTDITPENRAELEAMGAESTGPGGRAMTAEKELAELKSEHEKLVRWTRDLRAQLDSAARREQLLRDALTHAWRATCPIGEGADAAECVEDIAQGRWQYPRMGLAERIYSAMSQCYFAGKRGAAPPYRF